MRKIFWFLILAILLFPTPNSQALHYALGAICRTGGSTCLDGISPTDIKGDSSNIALTAGDMAMVVMDDGSSNPMIYFYRVYASSAAADDPRVIVPSSYGGTLRWHLVNVVGQSQQSAAADTAARIVLNSNTSRTPAASANELYVVANVWKKAENGTALGWTQSVTTEVDGHTSASLTAAQVSNTTIHNYGQAASDITLTLPTAAYGMGFQLTVGTAQASNKWRVRAGTNDKIYLIGSDGSITAGSNAGYFKIAAPVVGAQAACWTFKTDAYDWACKAIAGTWAAE